jgi:polyphosphate kinase 2 (PPK2 family)
MNRTIILGEGVTSALMKPQKVIERSRKFSTPFRITDGKKFKLKKFDPSDTLGLSSEDKPSAQEALATGIQALAELQDVLYAQDNWGVLLILQAMDAAGKDGVIKHVMSGVNPQGCQVHSFKTPSAEELDHDYLWRSMKCLPNRGHIGIFNRSYYEETLVVRVHPEFLTKEKVPASLITDHIWDERFQDIRSFERYLQRNGIVVMKFFPRHWDLSGEKNWGMVFLVVFPDSDIEFKNVSGC